MNHISSLLHNFFRALTILSLLFFLIPTTVNADPPQTEGVPLGTIQQIGGYTTDNSLSVKSAGSQLEKILSNVVGFLTIFAGLYFLVNFIVGALSWSGAGGDTNKVSEAQKRMTNGAIGLIIVIAAYSIIYIISRVLGLNILNVGFLIETQLKPTNLP